MQYIFYLDDSGTKEFVLGDKEYTRQGPPLLVFAQPFGLWTQCICLTRKLRNYAF